MKTSIEHLPEKAQYELQKLVEYILEDVPETLFVILYGSYARGEQIEYDQRVEFGMRTCFMSDFDIVVLTEKKHHATQSITTRLGNASKKYASGINLFLKPTVQFLSMSLEEFNRGITQGRYFYTDIRKEGIVLFDSGKAEIAEVRPLKYQQIYELSKEFFDEKYETAEDFLIAAKALHEKGRYRRCAFQLHQAVENYLLSIILSSSLYAPKEHNIEKLIEQSTLFTSVASDIFHIATDDDKQLFELLLKSYVQARYNKDFLVTQADIEALLAKIEQLRTQSHRVCCEKVEEHRVRAKESKL